MGDASTVLAGDAHALTEAAHALLGSSLLLGGAGRISELCAALEEIGAAGSVDGAAELAGALKAAYDVTSEALVRQVGSAAGRA